MDSCHDSFGWPGIPTNSACDNPYHTPLEETRCVKYSGFKRSTDQPSRMIITSSSGIDGVRYLSRLRGSGGLSPHFHKHKGVDRLVSINLLNIITRPLMVSIDFWIVSSLLHHGHISIQMQIITALQAHLCMIGCATRNPGLPA